MRPVVIAADRELGNVLSEVGTCVQPFVSCSCDVHVKEFSDRNFPVCKIARFRHTRDEICGKR
jgi:hypothetical protein